MTSLQYTTDPAPAGDIIVRPTHYSSAVKLPGGIIKVSGQGSCYANGNLNDVATAEAAQVARAFE
ncbi:hypothetical protein LTS18_010941, partial [Coniosporium uncinatum]